MTSMTERQTGTVQVVAAYDSYAEQRGEGRIPQSVSFMMMGVDAAELDAILSLFPKSARLHATSVSTQDGSGAWVSYPLATARIRLLADGVNGGRNEAGIKRLHAILRAAERAGLAVDFDAYLANSFDSLAELLSAIDGDVELAQVAEPVEQPAVGTVAADFDELSRAAETRELAVGSRVRRVLDGKVGEVVTIDGEHVGVEIDGEVWQGTRAAWIELCADCDEPCGFGHFGMYCVDCSGDVAFIAERDARDAALIEQQIAAEQAARDEQIENVRHCFGDAAAQLVVDGWTIDAAVAHVGGYCDRELCTGEHDEPVAAPVVEYRAAAARHRCVAQAAPGSPVCDEPATVDVVTGAVVRPYCAEHDPRVLDVLRSLGWNDEQIVAAIAAAARVDAVDNPPAHRVGCGCMSCDAARVESATAAELDAYEGTR